MIATEKLSSFNHIVAAEMRRPSVSETSSSSRNKKSNSNKNGSKSSTAVSAASILKETPLKRAIKENENSIIQSMLSPNRNNTSSDKDWLSPLLDYLFEDGQLTRIEYDVVDKAIGIDTATEQAKALLRILMETKDDEAIEALLIYLRSNKQDPSTCDTIRKLCANFITSAILNHPGANSSIPSEEGQSSIISRKGAGIRDVIEATRRHSLNSRQNRRKYSKADESFDDDDEDRITRVSNLTTAAAASTIKYLCVGGRNLGEFNAGNGNVHDFYYGRSGLRSDGKIVAGDAKMTLEEESTDKSEDETDDDNDEEDFDDDGDNDWFSYYPSEKMILSEMDLQKRKKEAVDFKDFYLTNACLEIVRNLIQLQCSESLTPVGWETVLRNMNGLLQGDILPIKDLILKLQSLLEERVGESDEENNEHGLDFSGKNHNADGNEILGQKKERNRRRRLIQSKLKSNNLDDIGNKSKVEDLPLCDLMMKVMKANALVLNLENTEIHCHLEVAAQWGQIIYNSLKIWKLRNGSNSTFYSLIGVFQHSRLYKIADCLLTNKAIIQTKENEKDVS